MRIGSLSKPFACADKSPRYLVISKSYDVSFMSIIASSNVNLLIAVEREAHCLCIITNTKIKAVRKMKKASNIKIVNEMLSLDFS